MADVTLGGDRLGAGNKNKVHLRNYERSTHDLSYAWRSSMAAGTLVPFMSELALPGDTFDIDLEAEVLTLPTIGPLFGSFKVQLDLFKVPIRLYNGKLHMNLVNIGLKMEDIKFPVVEIRAEKGELIDDNQQINPSSIFSYLGIRGLGRFNGTDEDEYIKRQFNAIPWLAYWDIFKQYYANKQEEKAYVIHNPMDETITLTITSAKLFEVQAGQFWAYIGDFATTGSVPMNWDNQGSKVEISVNLPQAYWGLNPKLNLSQISLSNGVSSHSLLLSYANHYIEYSSDGKTVKVTFEGLESLGDGNPLNTEIVGDIMISPESTIYNAVPKLTSFPLEYIEAMRKEILMNTTNPDAFLVATGTNDWEPYSLALHKGTHGYSITSSQEGLAVKTYQSDIFNNWMDTEYIDGAGGINDITAVSTAGDEFTIDALNLASKVYVMLNRIQISGGTYDDWLNAVYKHERMRGQEEASYEGGLIKELAFQEVISQSTSESSDGLQPLGQLAGRGKLTSKHKGGRAKIRVDEPCYIMGIVSLTPRIDYSQGNRWDTNLKNMNDLHKPALDAIGFQDLITDQMAWFDTEVDETGTPTFKSAGKQPAWINYMTNHNRVLGNFARQNSEMYMTLNRRYEMGNNGIQDLTTYIDPTKFNHIFAQTSLDAQNFWVQIGVGITARRKMSAKVIPSL